MITDLHMQDDMISYSFCVIGTAWCKRRYDCHKCIDEFYVYQKACSPVSMGPRTQAQGAQPQYQGKWISRLKADYIQCTWRRSEHPSINTQGFIYKTILPPSEGPRAELNHLRQGNWISRLKAGYIQCAWPRDEHATQAPRPA